MTLKIRFVTPLLIAGAASAAIAAAPLASAADDTHLSCSYQAPGNSQCETPGNAQLTATPQEMPYESQYPYLLGTIIFHNAPAHEMGGHR